MLVINDKAIKKQLQYLYKYIIKSVLVLCYQTVSSIKFYRLNDAARIIYVQIITNPFLTTVITDSIITILWSLIQLVYSAFSCFSLYFYVLNTKVVSWSFY